MAHRETAQREVRLTVGDATVGGFLTIPEGAQGVVLFAHGSGSGRFSTRNQYVAGVLQQAQLGTLLMDLLSAVEEAADARTGHLRFDIPFLAERVRDATRWLAAYPETSALPVGYFGASTGAAAALRAAADERDVFAIVSRGGRPDLALECLAKVRAPTLLIVGGADVPVIPLNQQAYDALICEKELVVIPGASHLFEEPGALEAVAHVATDWFARHVPP